MDKAKRFGRTLGIYFLGNILTKAVSFFMLPLYTAYIEKSVMGYFDLANSYLEIAVPLLAVTIWGGIIRFVFDYDEFEEKRKVIYNGFNVMIIAIFVMICGGFILGSLKDIAHIGLIVILGILMILNNVYGNAARGLGESKLYAASGVLGGLVNCISNVILILLFHNTDTSLFISLALGQASQVFLMEIKLRLAKGYSTKYFDRSLARSMLKYCLPVALNSCFFWFLLSYNRLAIVNTLGLEANGIYAIGAKFTYVIGLLANCITLAIQELLYGVKEEGSEKSKIYTIIAGYYIDFLGFGLMMLVPLVQLSFNLLIASQYREAFSIIPLQLFATICSFFAAYLGEILSAEKYTHRLFVSTVLAAGCNFGLVGYCIGEYGIQGANISLTIAYIVMIASRLILIGKDYKIKLRGIRTALILCGFVASWYIYINGSYFSNGMFLIATGAIFVILYRKLFVSIFHKVKNS